MEEAVQEEEESVATGEKVLERKELRAIRKTAYARLILGVVGVACLIGAILFGGMPPTVPLGRFFFGREVSIPGITLAFAGIACLSTAMWP